jgi:hypothetical protein
MNCQEAGKINYQVIAKWKQCCDQQLCLSMMEVDRTNKFRVLIEISLCFFVGFPAAGHRW